jgi:OOP family OmpA-OmpF porin
MLKNKLKVSWAKNALIIGVSCLSMSVSAHNPSKWVDSAGDVVNDGAGDCLHTVHWSKSPKCGDEPSNTHKHGTMEHAHDGGSATHEHHKPAPAPVAEVTFAPVPFSLSSGAAFDLSGSQMSDEGKAEIKAFADKLEGHDVKKITVEGYTDSTGPADFNQALSEKRANSVKDEMARNGIDASIITAIGHGVNDPVADNATREGRAANRRVTVTVEGLKPAK